MARISPRPFLDPDKRFIREAANRMVLNGWRYRVGIGLSTANRSYFGPRVGCVRMLVVTADDATIDFEAVVLYACDLRKSFPYLTKLKAYEKALEYAEHKLLHLRAELNRVVSEMIVNRRVSESIPQWDEELRDEGFNVIEFPVAPRPAAISQAAE